MAKEKKLSEADSKRLDELNKTIGKYEKEGYRHSFLTAATGKVYSLSILYGLIVSVPLLIIFIFANRGVNLFDQWNKPGHLIRFVIWMVALIVIHELIHGLFFSMFSKNRFKDVRFGFNVNSFVPYCSCKEPLKKAPYLIACFMPCLLLGIIPGIVAILTHSIFLFVIALIMIFGAGGDLLIIQMILARKAGKDSLYLDHPVEVGCVLLEK